MPFKITVKEQYVPSSETCRVCVLLSLSAFLSQRHLFNSKGKGNEARERKLKGQNDGELEELVKGYMKREISDHQR